MTIRQQVVRSTARGKNTKGFIERVLDITEHSNPDLPKEFAEHLMCDISKLSEDIDVGESSSAIPEDPDAPLIIKILPSLLKLLIEVKKLKMNLLKKQKKLKLKAQH